LPSSNNRPQRLLIIGLDGVPFSMIKGFAESGIMPSTGALLAGGFFKQMRSSAPEVSSVAWSSIITGTNPGRHGIFGFTDLADNSYRLKFPNFNDLREEPFWESACGKSVIINVPSTYPVKRMNGVHISGFVSIDINKSVYPPSIIPQLEKLDYRLDVDSEKAHKDLDLFLEDLDKTLTARIKAAEFLWDYTDWQCFMLTFTGTDRLMHFLYDAYQDRSHRYHQDFVNHFRRIDEAIGEIVSKTGGNDLIIMLSDHGFERLEKNVYVNKLLAEAGFLNFKSGTAPALENIDPGARAFALDPARIYLNRKGIYPQGGLGPDEVESCLSDLESFFSTLQLNGRRLIKHIYRRDQIYSGPYLERGPDLVLIAERGFNLRGSMNFQRQNGNSPFTGKHTYDDAFIFVSDGQAAAGLPQEPSVTDAGRLIRSLVADD